MQALVLDQGFDLPISAAYANGVVRQVGKVQVALCIHDRPAGCRDIGKEFHPCGQLLRAQGLVGKVLDTHLEPRALQRAVIQPDAIDADFQRVGVDA